MRALIVDDSRAMRVLLARILKEAGFEVLEAAHGAEALERLRRGGGADLALVDCNMPEMDGFEFARAVRSDRGLDGVRLLMVTTECEMEKVIRALECGVDDYIMKPFTKEVIIEKVALLGMKVA